MALEARVRSHYRWSSVVALEGTEFIKTEWRPVPINREDEALRTRELEVREKEEARIEIKIDASADADPQVDEKTTAIAEFLAQPSKPIIAFVEEPVEDKDKAEAVEFFEAARDAEAAKKKPRVTVVRAILKRLAELEAGGE